MWSRFVLVEPKQPFSSVLMCFFQFHYLNTIQGTLDHFINIPYIFHLTPADTILLHITPSDKVITLTYFKATFTVDHLADKFTD